MHHTKTFKFLILLIIVLSSVIAYLFIHSKKVDDILSRKNSTETIFDQRQACAKYKSAIEKNLEESNSTNGIFFLDELFFSPKRNSCVYAVSAILTPNGKVTSFYQLIDYLSNEKLVVVENEDLSIASQTFESKVSEYR